MIQVCEYNLQISKPHNLPRPANITAKGANTTTQLLIRATLTSEELLAAFLFSSIVAWLKVANTALKVERLHFASNTLMKLQTSLEKDTEK